MYIDFFVFSFILRLYYILFDTIFHKNLLFSFFIEFIQCMMTKLYHLWNSCEIYIYIYIYIYHVINNL
jgi:hypothetical protein